MRLTGFFRIARQFQEREKSTRPNKRPPTRRAHAFVSPAGGFHSTAPLDPLLVFVPIEVTRRARVLQPGALPVVGSAKTSRVCAPCTRAARLRAGSRRPDLDGREVAAPLVCCSVGCLLCVVPP